MPQNIDYTGKNSLTYIFTKIKEYITAQLANKVDKDGSKVLSTNDYTTAEKNKLQGIADNADVSAITQIKVNNVAVSPTDKTVNITVPQKVSDLTNDASYTTLAAVDEAGYQTSQEVESAITSKGYQTSSQVEATITSKGYQTESQVQTLINNSIGEMTGVSFEVVESLPQTGVSGTIYLVAHSHGSGDSYDEYIWLSDTQTYEKIGNTDIDLSQYVLSSDLVEISNSDVQELWDSVMGN